MASNLDRLRAKKAANLKKEADLSTSFSIDEATAADAAEAAHTDPQEPQESAHAAEATAAEAAPTVEPAIKPAKAAAKQPDTDSKPANTSKDSDANIPIKPITPIKETTESGDPVASPERNLGLRLSTDEDKRYLDLAPLGRGITKKAFFIGLMEAEFASVSTVDISDPELERFRNSSLKTTAITISVPETLIEQIKTYAAKHMMKYQRYIAYVVSKARLSDAEWSRINK